MIQTVEVAGAIVPPTVTGFTVIVDGDVVADAQVPLCTVARYHVVTVRFVKP